MRIKNLQQKRALHIALLVLLLNVVGMTNVLAQSFTVGDLNYSFNEGGITVTLTGHFYGTNASGTLDIPSEVTYNGHTYTVTAIGDNAFKDCTGLIGLLSIPNTVTTIGDYAFYNTRFTGNLTLSNALVSIGSYAFYCTYNNNYSGSLILPETLITIGDYAFYSPQNTYQNSNFSGNLTIPNSVTTIGAYAFNNCCSGNGTLTIGEGVQTIGKHAFSYCGFQTVNFNAIACTLMEHDGSSVFRSCSSLTTLHIGENVQIIPSYAFVYCSSFTGPLNIPNSVTTIESRAFADCSGFTGSLVIPDLVTTIGDGAFINCSGFTSLTLGNSVTSIDSYAFAGCSGFTGNLIIPNSVTIIGGGDNSLGGDGAFSDCSGFTGDLVIPNTVIEVRGHAFQRCSGFNSLTIGTSVNKIGWAAFSGCSGLTEVNYNATNCSQIGGSFDLFLGTTHPAFGTGSTQASLNIGDNVQTIPNYAFFGCSCFSGTLTIPNSVTTIGFRSFEGCSGFTSLVIGSSVTYVNGRAFYGFSGLTSMEILAETPPSVNTNYSPFSSVDYSIPFTVPCGSVSAYQTATVWRSFTNIQEYCDPLTYSINEDGVSVTVTGHVDGSAATGPLIIPETKTIDGVTYTVTAIDGWAFSGCTGLTGNLIIPNTVTFIGNGAFSNCSGFTGSLIIPNSVTTISYRAFYCCYGFTGSLTIGESVSMIGEQAFSACTGFTGSLILGNSVTSIGYDAFFNCNGFTGTLTIPSSVTIIYDWAFGYCLGFTAINSLAQIPARAQENIFNSLDYNIPVTVPCGSGSMYQYAWGWNVFTNIQEDCPDMFAVSATANPTEGGSVIFGTEGETLLADSFEDYTVGNRIAAEAIAASHDWWTTWSGEPDGAEDGIITAYNSTQCGHLTYGNDQILLLNKESGVYDLEFDILVPEGKNAFFSLLHQFEGSANEAMYCHLHAINDYYGLYAAPGHGSIRAGSYILADIPCVYDAWMHIRLYVDIDADIARFYFTAPGAEELLLCQWPWSGSNTTSGNTNCNLAAMDFWPPMDEATSEYYIDNFSLKQYEIGNTMISGNYFAPSSTCTLTAIPNEGYTFTNWTENGIAISTNTSYSFLVTSDRNLVANFTQNEVYHFITSGSWNNASNWSGGVLPGVNDEVFIEANCTLNVNAEVASLTVMEGQTLTLQPGHTLTVTGTLTNINASGLVIKDGAQLIHASEGVHATMEKNVTGFIGNGGYSLIAVPFVNELSVPAQMVAGNYDLYLFDQSYPNAEWRNYKANAFSLVRGSGYLYANSTGMTLSMAGQIPPASNPYSANLTFDANAIVPGFNLVGNPFTCDAYLDRPYYMLKEDGTGIHPVPVPATTPIPPCSAVMVKAVGENDHVVFTKAVQ